VKYQYIFAGFCWGFVKTDIYRAMSGPDGHVSPYHELVPIPCRYNSPYDESGVHKNPFPKVYKQP
jgi:hypothetical protein